MLAKKERKPSGDPIKENVTAMPAISVIVEVSS
jgi:hypothetical protein